MISLFFLGALVTYAVGVPVDNYQNRWTENCGLAKYPDAGERQGLPTNRIVGGIDAMPNELPYQISYRWKSSNRHFCGGVIIHPRWVLSAAHCSEGETASEIIIVAGEHDRTAANPARQSYDIFVYFNHEEYQREGQFDNDISIIKTTEMIVFSDDVAPACAPEPGNLYIGWNSTISGWGTLAPGGSTPNILQYTQLPISSNADCILSFTNNGRPCDNCIPDNMICAGRPSEFERDACQGDSGGPLAVKRGERFEIVGLTSWGYSCAAGPQGVYARVEYQHAWVTSKIEKNP